MNILKKLFLVIFFALILLLPKSSKAVDSAVCNVDNQAACTETTEAVVVGNKSGHTENCDKTISVYYGAECPHCQELDKYLATIVQAYPEIQVKKYEVWHNTDNLNLLKSEAQKRGVEAKNVPIVFVGHQTFIGYASDELTGVEIKKSIYDLYCIKESVGERTITLPLIHKQVKISSLSLPTLTVVFGFIDGFNPCAMWALIALITILMATEDRKKIRLVGTVFIISSWLIYYFFMAFYLNTFQLLTFVAWLRYIIGAVALYAGYSYLKDFKNYNPGVCKVTNQKQQRNLMERMKKVASHNSILLIVLGVIALSFSVNLVEMMCSLGLPVIYTQILTLNHLPNWQYYLYIAFYNTLYMADDIVVFIIAVTTMNYVHVNSKYDRWMKLVGGILILALGFVLIFKPSLLSF